MTKPPSSSVIDWSSKAEPWRSIGLAFRAECEAIAATRAFEPPPPLRREPCVPRESA
jgi:hypothetical protein